MNDVGRKSSVFVFWVIGLGQDQLWQSFLSGNNPEQ